MGEKFEEEFIEDLESSDDVLYTDEELGNEVIDLEEGEKEETSGGRSHIRRYTAYLRHRQKEVIIKTGIRWGHASVRITKLSGKSGYLKLNWGSGDVTVSRSSDWRWTGTIEYLLQDPAFKCPDARIKVICLNYC